MSALEKFNPIINFDNVEKIKLPKIILNSEKLKLPEAVIENKLSFDNTTGSSAQIRKTLDEIEFDRLVEKRTFDNDLIKPYTRSQLLVFAEKLGINKSMSKADLVKHIKKMKMDIEKDKS